MQYQGMRGSGSHSFAVVLASLTCLGESDRLATERDPTTKMESDVTSQSAGRTCVCGSLELN